jgi:hypothetical protein
MPIDNFAVDVIDRTALIENIINQIIEAFCEPRQEPFMFFWNVILDSSIMPFGSKVRVVMAIAQEMNVKLDQNSIHTVMSLRNAFAHHPSDSHPVMVVGKTPAEDASHYELQILSSSGKLSRKRRKDAVDEFNSSYNLAKVSLVGLLDKIKSSRSTSAA